MHLAKVRKHAAACQALFPFNVLRTKRQKDGDREPLVWADGVRALLRLYGEGFWSAPAVLKPCFRDRVDTDARLLRGRCADRQDPLHLFFGAQLGSSPVFKLQREAFQL